MISAVLGFSLLAPVAFSQAACGSKTNDGVLRANVKAGDMPEVKAGFEQVVDPDVDGQFGGRRRNHCALLLCWPRSWRGNPLWLSRSNGGRALASVPEKAGTTC